MAETLPLVFKRFSDSPVSTALKDTPVVLVTGPRQCGKTTLVRKFVTAERVYISLDDDTVLLAARNDPTGFVRGLDRAIIDEVQRAPELMRAIKKSVDEDRRPGRFLLTGSANILALPQASESLAGRMEMVSLFPLAISEIRGRKPTFLARAFGGKLPKPPETLIGIELVRTVLRGGYPEMLTRKEPKRRLAWARDYVRAIVQRDVRDIATVDRLDQMARLLQVLAHHSGKLTNFAQIGGQIGLDDKTTRRYISLLEHLFIVRRVEPWFRNPLKRVVKTSKLHFLDSGLLASLGGATEERIARERSTFGSLLETFAFAEILKQTAWLEEGCSLYHYRDKDQSEVDIVLESDSGAVIGIEVKAAATVNAGDLKGLRKLAEACGSDFKLGVVLYDGADIVPFAEHLFAAPIACMWG